MSNNTPRMLHTMLRVRDLERSILFYTKALGMKVLRREDYHEAAFTLVFIGYGAETSSTVLELTWNHDNRTYKHGSHYGHIAIGVPDLMATCEKLAKQDVKVTRLPGPMAHTIKGHAPQNIAFIEDPDGFQIELIETTS